MKDKIKQYYQERVNIGDGKSLLWQVGKTVNGKEVSAEQIDLIIETIVKRLRLGAEDKVLDIGCGNGLLTKEIATYVSQVTGVELTPELFEMANSYSSQENVSYMNCDILELKIGQGAKQFNKVYLYEVMQHIPFRDVNTFFNKLNEITTDSALIFIGGILDVERKWGFINTEERRCEYFEGLMSGRDPLGTWYHKDFFYCLAKRRNYSAECVAQHNNLYTSHYRFDCLIRKDGGNVQ